MFKMNRTPKWLTISNLTKMHGEMMVDTSVAFRSTVIICGIGEAMENVVIACSWVSRLITC